MCAKFKDRSFTRLRNIEGVPKFRNWVTYPRRRPLRGQFVVHGQELPTALGTPNLKIVALPVCEILRGSQNFEIGSRTPGDGHLGPICGPGQELPTAYVRTKFEGRSFIRLRNIGTFHCGALIDPVTLTFDLLTLKSVWESHVTWGTPVQTFVFLGLLVFELEPMYVTSDRRTDADDRLMPPPPLRGRECPRLPYGGGGIINYS